MYADVIVSGSAPWERYLLLCVWGLIDIGLIAAYRLGNVGRISRLRWFRGLISAAPVV